MYRKFNGVKQLLSKMQPEHIDVRQVDDSELTSEKLSECARHFLCLRMNALPSKTRGFAFILHTGVVERKLSGFSNSVKGYSPKDHSVAVACHPAHVH